LVVRLCTFTSGKPELSFSIDMMAAAWTPMRRIGARPKLSAPGPTAASYRASPYLGREDGGTLPK
jgi:hypothetical protein